MNIIWKYLGGGLEAKLYRSDLVSFLFGNDLDKFLINFNK